MSITEKLEEKWINYIRKKYNLTDIEIEEYIYVYDLINNGNEIDINSLRDFLNEFIEYNQQKWSNNEVQVIISKINSKFKRSNNLIKIDLLTFLLYIIPLSIKKNISKMEIREFFDMMDHDKDGFITYDEFSNMITKLNDTVHHIYANKKTINRYIKSIDKNNDGKISYDEFKDFIINSKINKK